jgi:hypothetical protein
MAEFDFERFRYISGSYARLHMVTRATRQPLREYPPARILLRKNVTFLQSQIVTRAELFILARIYTRTQRCPWPCPVEEIVITAVHHMDKSKQMFTKQMTLPDFVKYSLVSDVRETEDFDPGLDS